MYRIPVARNLPGDCFFASLDLRFIARTIARASLTMPPMLRRASLLSLALLSLNLSGCNTPTRATHDVQQGWAVYGTFEETLRSVTPELSPEILLAHPEDFVGTGELLVLDGHVAQVCLTMGCWLEIEGADQATILVMNKDHAFFVPRNCRGRNVHATGYAFWQVQTVEMLQHLASDAGKSAEEIAAIVVEERKIVFIADSVVMAKHGLDEPAAPLPAETETPPEVGGIMPGITPVIPPAEGTP